MPGLDLDIGQYSSNWKKLQAQLKTAPKEETSNNGLKRKRPAEKSTAANGHKKVRLDDPKHKKPVKRTKRTMGTSTSQPTPTSHHSTLRKDHDIPAQDISAAYNANTLPFSHDTSKDEINAGLHPTNKAGKYIALDCEMVGIGPPPHTDNLLARVSVVNYHGQQLYDSYVLPPANVTVGDYRTPYSGIHPHHLHPNSGARSFADVQNSISTLLQNRILVGHALSNDLRVLILNHPKRDLRDTSRYAKFRVESKGKPPALRHLAKSELGLRIQTGEHSSLEDARAAMGLFRKEKVGFEEEVRRTFGPGRRVVVGEGKGKDGEDEEGGEGGGEDDEDDEAAEETPTPNTPAAPAVKKRKKKKNTKRK